MLKLLLRPLSVRTLADKATTTSKPKLSSKLSNTPHPPKDPPDVGYNPECVSHPEIEVADYVRPKAYRQFCGPDEVLGPGAGKSKEYKASQYFGYHRFSFVELQNQTLEMRDERRANGGVQESQETEEECDDDSLENMKEREAECEKQLAEQAKDCDKAKLQARCEKIEKKQKEMEKLKMSNLGKEELQEWCEKMEKKQEKQNKEKEEAKLCVNKKVTDILTECADKLTKAVAMVEDPKKDPNKKDTDKVLVDSKKLVIKAAKEKKDECAKPKGKKPECAIPKEKKLECAKPKENKPVCAKPKENDSNKEKENCKKPDIDKKK